MIIAAFLSLMLVPQTVAKTDTISAVATIQAIDAAKRLVTIKDEDGVEDTIYVDPELKRFNELKVGDKIKVEYRESIVMQLRKPGDPVKAASDKTSLTAGTGKTPGGTLAREATTTVTVVSVDEAAASLTVKTAEGRTITRKVEDRKNLTRVKAGDRIDITLTQAAMVDVVPVK